MREEVGRQCRLTCDALWRLAACAPDLCVSVSLWQNRSRLQRTVCGLRVLCVPEASVPFQRIRANSNRLVPRRDASCARSARVLPPSHRMSDNRRTRRARRVAAGGKRPLTTFASTGNSGRAPGSCLTVRALPFVRPTLVGITSCAGASTSLHNERELARVVG